MFNINETVMYGSSGVCEIVDIQSKRFNGEDVMYYVIRPIDQDNSTIYCPVNGKARIRKLLTAQEVHNLMSTVPDSQEQWIDNDRRRHDKFSETIKGGDHHEIMMMIKSIRACREEKISEGKRLHSNDERFLRDAESAIYSEFACALDMDIDDVIPMIESKL